MPEADAGTVALAAAPSGEPDAGSPPPLAPTTDAVAATAAAAPVPSAAAPPQPHASVVLERPYKLGARPDPKDPAAWKEYIRELRAWNDGGLGALVAEQPAPEGHPDPRVIIDIEQARGGLDAKTVERISRQYHWINVVRCYRLGFYQEPTLHGWTRGRFTISRGGKVTGHKLAKSELGDAAVAKCLLERLSELGFPRAKAGTEVKIAIKVSPGDEPLPPPDDKLVPGDGELSPDEILLALGPVLPAWEACYRAGLGYAPELWGRIPIRFHLTTEGKLDEAFDELGRFPEPRVKQCILHAARQARFPRPRKGDVRFVVPVRMSSDRSAHASAASPELAPAELPTDLPH